MDYWKNLCINIVEMWMANWDRFLITGLSNTLSLAAVAVIFGTIFGALIALMRMSKFKPIKWIAGAYNSVIRGTPMLLQIYIFCFALPELIPALGRQKFICVAIALLCNSAAYVSEIIRSGIQAVDAGQTEAARSLGMDPKLTMTEIVLPQAVKNILPALGNEFIMLVKDTALASTFFLGDVMTQAKLIQGVTFLQLEPLIIAAIIYFIVTSILNKVLELFERRMRRGDIR